MSKQLGSVLSSQRGFTLIETFMAMGLMVVSLASVIGFSSYLGQHQKTERQKAAIYDFKEELIVSLNNKAYWQNIISKAGAPHPRLDRPMNAELACVRDGTTCTEGDYDLTLFSPEDKIRFDAQDPAFGFNSRGEVCNTFNANAESESSCAFRFKLSWSPICELGTSSCINPLIRIQVDLLLNPRLNFQMNTTDLSFNYTLVAEPISDPTIKNIFLYTNSTILNFGTSALDIDLAQTVEYSGPISSLGFSTASPTSAYGGTITITGATLHYEPAPGHYGRDVISLNVTAPSGNVLSGLITIGVMTPHTWLGPMSGASLGETRYEENFCGQVIDGFCDRASFPVTNDRHFIFNDLCLACEAVLNSNATTFEMASSYTSTVWLGEFAPNIGWSRGNVWPKYPVFEQKSGRFAQLPSVPEPAMTISAFVGWGVPHSPNSKAFALRGGEFVAPRSIWFLRVIGGVDIAPGVFKHNQGKFEVFSLEPIPGGSSDLNLFRVQDPLTEFWNLSFGTISSNLGDNVGIDIGSSFIVKNRLGVYPQFNSWSFTDRDALCTWKDGNKVIGNYSDDIIISVQGDIEVRKGGGRGTSIGCEAPQIRFVGAGEHRIVGNALRAFNPDPVSTATWINNQVPHLPFLKITDPNVSVRVEGSVGFRRGLVNESNSRIDFSNAAVVLGNTDPGTVTFQPETIPGVIKNPFRDLYFANSGGGQVILGSRQIQVDGGLFSLFDNETAIRGNGPVGTVSEIHAHGNVVLGPGEHFKNQSMITEPVRLVISGANAQTVYGGAQAATFGRTGYDGQTQMDVHIRKPAGAGVARLEGLLTFLRDYIVSSGTVYHANGSALYIPDSGNNSFVHNIGMGTYVSGSTDFAANMSLNHNIRIVSDLFSTNFHWNTLNYSLTKTVEAAAPNLAVRALEKFILSTMNQSGAFDTPLQSVGPNIFELYPLYGYGGPQGVFRPVVEVMTPNSEVVNLPQMNLTFSGWNHAGYVRAIDFKGRLSVRAIRLGGQTWVCMYPSSNGSVSSLTAPRTELEGHIKPSALMTNGQTLTPGTTTLRNGSIIANSDPTYPCP